MQHIEIRELIAAKNPKLLKLLPRFVLSYLRRILHQDEVNHVLTTFRVPGLQFTHDVLRHLNIAYRVEGAEQLLQGQRYLFVSNHPLGGLDGMVIMSAIGDIFPNIKFPVNDLLLHLEPLQPLFVPINKHGGQTGKAASQLRECLASDSQMLYFPAGLCSRKIKGEIVDLPWKKSFVKMATTHGRSVVPMFFDGRNSRFFYCLANLRKRLGVKANIEMLYLPDEMFRQRNGSFTLRIGQPIPSATFTSDRRPQEWADFVRKKVYEMQ
ncbi:MAG: 1-acyl-sn-glycerol-3-phosphate acyltransferase [Prevotellaceae bacterium]|jgi:putative hemolysin|nr:1-acyl-sn-glycerol-3-phosphate acyltransferase [Prevotellaceae bacterium]